MYPLSPLDVEAEFPRRRRKVEEEETKPKLPKTLLQHLKEWLAGK